MARGPQHRPEPPLPETRFEHRGTCTLVFATGRRYEISVRDGAGAEIASVGVRWAIGVPIHIEGRLWGIIGSLHHDTPPPTRKLAHRVHRSWSGGDRQRRSLRAPNARNESLPPPIPRHRSGAICTIYAQQRLVTALQLRRAQPGRRQTPRPRPSSNGWPKAPAAHDELRGDRAWYSPSRFAKGGLVPARGFAPPLHVPVHLDVRLNARLPEPFELAAYYVVAEALTNAAKHADADRIDVDVVTDGDVVRVSVRDNGRGGADLSHGSGLVGLKDRVETLGGQISLDSPLAPARA